MKRAMAIALVAVFAGTAAVAMAENKTDPTGTWKWSTNRGSMTIKLKLDGDTLTGALVRNGKETPIEEGTYKDGEISFSVTRERNGQKTTSKYSGKVKGDTIQGTIDTNGTSHDWKATRAKN